LEEAWATLKLRDAEVARLTGELVQEAVLYEELRNKRPRLCAQPLRRRKSRSRVSCPSRFFAYCLDSLRSALVLFAFSLSALRTALRTSVTQAEAL
jgi:hypothetical protein